MHTIHPLYTQRHMTLTWKLIFWLIHYVQPAENTHFVYDVCALYVPLRCVVYWGRVEQLTKRIHIYHFHIAYCLVSWIYVRVKRDRYLLWSNNYETRCVSLSVTDICCDPIIMKQDVFLCLLVGFWHLCHRLKFIMCIILCVNFFMWLHSIES